MDQISELGLDSALAATFEPQQRARSNTWPLPRPENFVDKEEMELDTVPDHVGGTPPRASGNGSGCGMPPKKNSSRRNAWGNMSYADLITQAITSSPDKRLTLSQIYDWMVQNVSYFKDKGDSNSSAGWKNSIRHNLSLHNRFVRVQNEGAGKSSWWMINQDAPAGKAARRRAASMETQKFEKKRGRVKKKVEAMRNGIAPPDATPSPSSSVSENLDMFPDSPGMNSTSNASNGNNPVAFQLSPDFRPRASSNASSCSRLSPITALDQDNQVPPLSPISWNNDMVSMYSMPTAGPPAYSADVDNMKLCDSIVEAMTLNDTLPLKHNTAYGSYFKPSPLLYSDLSSARSMSIDVVPNLGRVKLEPREVYCNSSLSSGVKPPPTIPESQELTIPCSPTGLLPRIIPSRLPMNRQIKQEPSVSASLGCTASQLRSHILASDCSDLNIDGLDTLHGGLECDVDQVIKHELSVDGSLDFNFSESAAPVQNQVHLQPSQGPRSWVH